MDNTKETILNAAQTIFTQKGFDGASIELIAKEAGVAKALLYYHFKNKDEMLSEVLKRVLTNLFAYLSDSRLNENNVTNEQELSALLERHFEFISSQREVLSIALSEALKADVKNDNPVFEIPKQILQQFPFDITEETKLLFGFLSMAYSLFICLDGKVSEETYNNYEMNAAENIIRKELIQMLLNKFQTNNSSAKDEQ